ncbi:hypothetical protein CLU79DRAFT_720883 [Phycomyces nitens]|nr:hypothetical protein CLU79DRAFT_720883 [Phycomyces nitens]
MKLPLVLGLGSVVFGFARGAPFSPFRQSSFTNDRKCLELIQPLNGTAWSLDSAHDISWKIVGDCECDFYMNIIPVKDYNGDINLGDSQYTSRLDVESGKTNVKLDDLEGEGGYVVVIGPISEDWAEYADMAYIEVHEANSFLWGDLE